MAVNAISDVGTQLYAKIGVATTYTAFLKIKSAPATGGAPNELDMTVLSDVREKKLGGRLTTPSMEFDYNYTADNLALALTADTGEAEKFLIVYGDGTGVEITGIAKTWVDAVGLNAVVTGKFHITAEDVDNKTVAEVTALITP